MVALTTGVMGYTGEMQSECIPKLDCDQVPRTWGPDSARSTISGDNGSSTSEPASAPEEVPAAAFWDDAGATWLQADAAEFAPLPEADAWYYSQFAAWPPAFEGSEELASMQQPWMLQQDLLLQDCLQEGAYTMTSGDEQQPMSVQFIDQPPGLEEPSELSVGGSTLHFVGQCKPCAFAYEGCLNGRFCEFCHLCPPGERKRRKREKKFARRMHVAAGDQGFHRRS